MSNEVLIIRTGPQARKPLKFPYPLVVMVVIAAGAELWVPGRALGVLGYLLTLGLIVMNHKWMTLSHKIGEKFHQVAEANVKLTAVLASKTNLFQGPQSSHAAASVQRDRTLS
jgi:hypothetical protein